MSSRKESVAFLDFTRVVATFFVLLTHATEHFYISPEGGVGFRRHKDFGWVMFINSSVRSCVPLFVMISGYLHLPMKMDSSPAIYFRKRISRVLIPFWIWSIIFAILTFATGMSTDFWGDLQRTLYNFSWSSGHLWFVYMIFGLYLITPIISPWLQSCSHLSELIVLCTWFLTTFRHLLTEFLGLDEMFGECFWNEFSTFHYLSGYIGYYILGHYLKTYIVPKMNVKTLYFAIAMSIIGLSSTIQLFRYSYFTHVYDNDSGVYNQSSTLAQLELGWRFCTPNIAVMSIGHFLLLAYVGTSTRQSSESSSRGSKGEGGGMMRKLAGLTYGVYLVHPIFLHVLFGVTDSLSWGLATPVAILSVGGLGFILSFIFAKFVTFLPFSRFLIGS